MKVNKDTLKRMIYRLQGQFKSTLPVGVPAFETWCDKLLFTYFPEGATPPTQESFRFAIAAMILHMNADQDRVPNKVFGAAIIKGAANEVAGGVMQTLKAQRDLEMRLQQEAFAQKALENKKAEIAAQSNLRLVEAPNAGVSSEKPI